jgi:hypothetical protein
MLREALQFGRHGAALSRADDRELYMLAGWPAGDPPCRIGRTSDRGVADRHDDVALTDASSLSR